MNRRRLVGSYAKFTDIAITIDVDITTAVSTIYFKLPNQMPSTPQLVISSDGLYIMK